MMHQNYIHTLQTAYNMCVQINENVLRDTIKYAVLTMSKYTVS